MAEIMADLRWSVYCVSYCSCCNPSVFPLLRSPDALLRRFAKSAVECWTGELFDSLEFSRFLDALFRPLLPDLFPDLICLITLSMSTIRGTPFFHYCSQIIVENPVTNQVLEALRRGHRY